MLKNWFCQDYRKQFVSERFLDTRNPQMLIWGKNNLLYRNLWKISGDLQKATWLKASTRFVQSSGRKTRRRKNWPSYECRNNQYRQSDKNFLLPNLWFFAHINKQRLLELGSQFSTCSDQNWANQFEFSTNERGNFWLVSAKFYIDQHLRTATAT